MTSGWLADLLEEATGAPRSTSAQLQMSLGSWERQPHVVRFGPEDLGRLEVELGPWGAYVEFDLPEIDGLTAPQAEPPLIEGMDAWEVERFPPPEVLLEDSRGRCVFHAEFRVARPVRVIVPTLEIGRHLILPDLDGDGIVDTTRTLLRFLADVQWAHAREVHRDSLLAAARLIFITFDHLQALCCRQVWRVARRFPTDSAIWWFVYEAVANDPSGRMLQMVDVCPGLMILASGLRDLGQEDLCSDIIGATKRGLKLGRVLDIAVNAWWSLAGTGKIGRGSSISDEEKRRQRIRVRHAGRLVHPAVLVHPSLPGICREDIPLEPGRNAQWFEATSHAMFYAMERGMYRSDGASGWSWPDPHGQPPDIPMAGLSCEQLHGLGSFLSRHWRALGIHDPGDGRLNLHAVRELADYLRGTRRCPSRRTNPQRLREECDHWHAYADWSWHAEVPPETPLRTGGLEEWTTSGAKITPLKTVAELIQESETMRHCVASYAVRGAIGEAQFFHADIDGSHVTVMTTRRGNQLELLEAAGECNRPATEEEDAVLSAWLGDMQAQGSSKSW